MTSIHINSANAVSSGSSKSRSLSAPVVAQAAPGAQLIYQVPGAMLGYEPGFGQAYDVQAASSSGSTTTVRMIVIAAVKNGVAVVAIAVGPRLDPVGPSSPEWDGHPSPADVAIAYQVDSVINTITFSGQ